MGLFTGFKQLLAPALSKVPSGPVDVDKRFELAATAGQGSMSKVYWARDRKSGRMVCVKLLDKQLTAAFENRFRGLNRPTEGAIGMALHHPNIVQTLEHGLTTLGQQYIVMEMIEGRRLDALVESKSPQLEGNRVKLALQVAYGLEYIHRQGFVHRDLCPRNVLVDHRGVPKIIDFGLSVPLRPQFCGAGRKSPADEPGPETLRAVTPYMDPVLFRRGIMDHHIDLFALGVTVYVTVTGRLPWTSEGGAAGGQPRDPRKLVPRLDAATADFLTRSIDPDPDVRFQTATEMRSALQELPER